MLNISFYNPTNVSIYAPGYVIALSEPAPQETIGSDRAYYRDVENIILYLVRRDSINPLSEYNYLPPVLTATILFLLLIVRRRKYI